MFVANFRVGECVSTGPGDGALAGLVEFVDPSVPIAPPMAEAVCHLCKAGVMKAVSTGFLARGWEFPEDKARRDSGADTTSCEPLGFSVVGIPCYPGSPPSKKSWPIRPRERNLGP